MVNAHRKPGEGFWTVTVNGHATSYTIEPGAYCGTSDDCAGRWYIGSRNQDAIDHRGRGYGTIGAALEVLAERLGTSTLPGATI